MKSKFCKMVNEAIADEKHAQKFYRRMKKGQKKSVKKVIDHVKFQEHGHAKLFKKLKREMC